MVSCWVLRVPRYSAPNSGSIPFGRFPRVDPLKALAVSRWGMLCTGTREQGPDVWYSVGGEAEASVMRLG